MYKIPSTPLIQLTEWQKGSEVHSSSLNVCDRLFTPQRQQHHPPCLVPFSPFTDTAFKPYRFLRLFSISAECAWYRLWESSLQDHDSARPISHSSRLFTVDARTTRLTQRKHPLHHTYHCCANYTTGKESTIVVVESHVKGDAQQEDINVLGQHYLPRDDKYC